MSPTEQTPQEVLTYGGLLADGLHDSSGQRLVGAYLHGSAVLGGWLPTQSDVDLLVVLQEETPTETLVAVEHALVDSIAACPGTGLECSVVLAGQAASPAPPWPFLLHVQSSPRQVVRRVRGDCMDGDPDLLMHYAVSRAAGVSLFGPDPAAVIGVVPRVAILAYLVDELDWALAHGSEAYAVLNACRALVYAADGHLVSKISGGRRALDQKLGPADLIGRALDEQQGRIPPRPVSKQATEFVRGVANGLQPDLGNAASTP
jgi:hypothetical protein